MAFSFSTIRNVPKKLNFGKYIETMTIFSAMIRGYDAEIREVTEKDAKFLRKMVDSRISSATGSVNPYIVNLFHHFVEKVTMLNIDLVYSKVVKVPNTNNYYGYKVFRSMWFGDDEDDNSIKITEFLKVFKQLKSFTIFRWMGFKHSLRINMDFMMSLVDTVKFVELDKSLRRHTQKIIIVNPKVEEEDGMKGVSNVYNRYFREYGWELVVITKWSNPTNTQLTAPALCLQKKVE